VKLETKCNNCGEYIEFYENVSDRTELSFEKGDTLELTCKACNKSESYHVNRIDAIKNRLISIIGFLITIVAIFLIYHLIHEIYVEYQDSIEKRKSYSQFARILVALVIPLIIYQTFEKQRTKKIRNFNSYRIKE
jgi:uncharacterized membrane protein